MATKIRDVTVKTGEYQDRNTGETKGRWQNVGSLMRNDDDQSYFIVLDRTFNPAGVPNPDNRSSLILSCFVPQDRREGNQQKSQENNGSGGGYASGGNQQSGGAPMEDEIPF